ncbi:MAG TPA: hypothetical protein VJQ52_24610 [Steroidobacteraceae bacterium]|nr:hypothetical protein [Steroidobacteraceae bacterium]
MPTNSAPDNPRSLVAPEVLHALGVLVPLHFEPLRVMPGRHPLGRTGDGMRLLRTRDYIPGEDNPRDIDKFSPPHARQVFEWENEAQAAIVLLADDSASMSIPVKSAVRNVCILQLTYSLWRAGDVVSLLMFDDRLRSEIRCANLRTQMAECTQALRAARSERPTALFDTLTQFSRNQRRRCDLLFVVSDFIGTADEDPAADVERWRELTRRYQRKLVPIVVSCAVSDQADGVAKAWDPERGTSRLLALSRRRVQQLNALEQQRVGALTGLFQAAGLDYIVLTEPRQVYPALARFARMRRSSTS